MARSHRKLSLGPEKQTTKVTLSLFETFLFTGLKCTRIEMVKANLTSSHGFNPKHFLLENIPLPLKINFLFAIPD